MARQIAQGNFKAVVNREELTTHYQEHAELTEEEMTAAEEFWGKGDNIQSHHVATFRHTRSK